MDQYTQLILNEIENRRPAFTEDKIDTIYFGGGTPSLLPAHDILTIVRKLNNSGFKIAHDAEITIEINPGTIDQKKLDLYRVAGVNRFSVGIQSFNDPMLKRVGREHSAEDSRRTLKFLKENTINYSFDLLFGLPGQTVEILEDDLNEMMSFSPPHVSAYLLTVPEAHPMNKNRAPDETQAGMFNHISQKLTENGWLHYEISNYAKPGFHSRHNSTYWNDQAYWGLGVSAHSYHPGWSENGTRFWNSPNIKSYIQQSKLVWGPESRARELPLEQVENLKLHEAMTDYSHTQLRKAEGLDAVALRSKFPQTFPLILERMEALVKTGQLVKNGEKFSLSKDERVRANGVFFELTFLADEIV